MKISQAIDVQESNTCQHCNRSFVRESTLIKHLCEQKLRWQERDRPQNRIAYDSWLTFYSRIQPGKKKKDYKAFAESAYYSAFLRFGTYCVNVKVVNVAEYLNHLLSNNVSIDNWSSDSVYTKYLTQYLRTEDAYDAVKRSIKTMLEIADAENIRLQDVLNYYNKNKLCHLISTGHISPWVLYLSDSGNTFLSELNMDQRAVIWEYIDTERWNIKFKRDLVLMNEIKTVIDMAFK
jgi:hypothetical protein